MCGVVGYHHLDGPGPPDQTLLETMLGVLAHRGPDEFGIYADQYVGLGSARLSIIDLENGTQPICNEDGTVWIVFNGEIFNHGDLQRKLQRLGHHFATRSDTEAIVHLYEEYGEDCVEQLNGQFAFAIWDYRDQASPKLVMARDRVGIRPLFYTTVGRTLLFASEIKSLLVCPDAVRRLDPLALSEVFTLWGTIGSRTPFEGVYQVPPAHVLVATGGNVKLHRYWDFDFGPDDPSCSDHEYVTQLRDLMQDATDLRLNADVPVGSYLSGGVDSTTVTRLARNTIGDRLQTFSVAFEAAEYDERTHQEAAVRFLETDHASIECRDDDIGRVFPEVVYHAEWPMLRTAPAPMFMLSRLVNEHGIKVVLTGEGADEIFCGYNIFKEDRVRRFWAREPDSVLRPLLFRKLYPYIADLNDYSTYLAAFFGRDLTDTSRPEYSHLIRWTNTGYLRRTFSRDLRASIDGYDPIAEVTARLTAHPRFASWTPLARAQYIEMTHFMSGYLLSSQGDRMLMAHSVEGRFPFLDHRVIEFAARLPDRMKLRGLNEKYVLKLAMKGSLPDQIVWRTKQPFRAPIQSNLLTGESIELLSPRHIRHSGIFEPAAVATLTSKLRRQVGLGERDAMALTGVLSTLILQRRFVDASPHRHARPIRLARCCIPSLSGGDLK